MLAKIAPWLASIGIHKNGTWAAQKIIDTANTDQQVNGDFENDFITHKVLMAILYRSI